MIRAFVFDLDGTLVQSELLKARSYAHAVNEFGATADDAAVFDAYREVVGRSREEVSRFLVTHFNLEAEIRRRPGPTSSGEAWEAFVEVRLDHYDRMLSESALIRRHRLPHALQLLELARQMTCRVALVTTSDRARAERVLDALDIRDAFHSIVTADDVEEAKPDPEGYGQALFTMGLAGPQCLALEDSVAGIEAALAAHAHCVAVPTDFTRQLVLEKKLLSPRWIVEDPASLMEVVGRAVRHVNAA